jgi:hypothetical protein
MTKQSSWPNMGDPSGANYGRWDWSTERGLQTEPPKAPPAVRLAYLLEQVADEFRGLKGAAADDGKDDVLVAETCTLELGITWTMEGDLGIKFWVLDVGASVTRQNAQKVTVEMSLLPKGVPLIARTASPENATRISQADAITWDSRNEPPVEDRAAIKTSDGGTLRLALMLEKLADEFRRARAAAANNAAILRYDKVTLELSTTLTADAQAGAKFWVIDVAAKGTHAQTEDITVVMTPADLKEIIDTGVAFVR